jgi:uncharacterized protein YndB with AHSA1/START domain
MSDGFTITRTFNAPAKRVYEAFTRPEDFSVWFGTAAISVPLETLHMDVRVGGKWTAVMHIPGYGTKDWAGEYTELVPYKRLAFTLTDEPSLPAGEPVTVDLKESGGRTEMTFWQARHGFSDEQIEAVKNGYGGFFDEMGRIVEAS